MVLIDIEKFFDSTDHCWLLRTLGQRIGDPRLLRLIAQMLRCSMLPADGVMAEKLAGTCFVAMLRWLNRRSRRRSYTQEQFMRRLWFSPLPVPPRTSQPIDICSAHVATRNHNPKRWMSEKGTSGSVRCASLELAPA